MEQNLPTFYHLIVTSLCVFAIKNLQNLTDWLKNFHVILVCILFSLCIYWKYCFQKIILIIKSFFVLFKEKRTFDRHTIFLEFHSIFNRIVKYRFGNRLNLHGPPSTERHHNNFTPNPNMEDLNHKLHCSLRKTMCLGWNYILTSFLTWFPLNIMFFFVNQI